MVQEAEKLKNNCPLSLVVNSITMHKSSDLSKRTMAEALHFFVCVNLI